MNNTNNGACTDYQISGFSQAGRVGGDPNVLPRALKDVYGSLRKKIDENLQMQNERKIFIQNEINDLFKAKEDCSGKIQDELSRLELERENIKKVEIEIDQWKQNPQEMLKGIGKDAYDKITFWVGGFILLLLTGYLFVFYSSAAYSAFFRTFSIDDATIVNSIFDTNALLKAYNESVTTLLFILLITAVFLGLGFLINVFHNEQGRIVKYLKLFFIIVVTFIFDVIIAYEICSKTYDIKVAGAFLELPEFTIEMALHQVNFWLIIFAGFIVYIIWGLVYNAFAQEFKKFDAKQYNIMVREKKKEAFEKECNKIMAKKQALENEQNAISTKITNKQNEKERPILYYSDISSDIDKYVFGWFQYVKGLNDEQQMKNCEEKAEEFFKELKVKEFSASVYN